MTVNTGKRLEALWTDNVSNEDVLRRTGTTKTLFFTNSQ